MDTDGLIGLASFASEVQAFEPSHHLLSLAMTGGFLDKLCLDFSPGLNCIIGGRGAGKTTIIELIRYALDILPEESFRKRYDDLIKANLGSGNLKLTIRTREGVKYIILRAYGQPPVLLTEDEKPVEFSLTPGGLFDADLFSLNQIENMADQPGSQLALLDSFEQQAIGQHNLSIQQTQKQLEVNALELAPLEAEIVALREALNELSTVDEQLRVLDEHCPAQELPVKEAADQQALRMREKSALEQLLAQYAAFGKGVAALKGAVADLAARHITDEMRHGPNGEVFAPLADSFNNVSARFDGLVEQLLEPLRPHYDSVTEAQRLLAVRHTEQDVGYLALAAKQQEWMDAAAKRNPLHARRNELLEKQRVLRAKEERCDALLATRRELLDVLAHARNERFRLRKAIADKINAALNPDVRVEVVQDGSRDGYDRHLEGLFKSHGVYGDTRAKLIRSLWPHELADICMGRDKQALIDRAGVTPKMAEHILEALADHLKALGLEAVETTDDPHISLNDCGAYKRAAELSTGQKCTTILPILMMEHERPLIVDQPEDNLDNRYVSDKVVRTLHKMKPKRQIIFTTHNPNIPVLGNAERVFVMESDGAHGALREHGTVDACRGHIVNLLEGGEEAFRLRAQRYGS